MLQSPLTQSNDILSNIHTENQMVHRNNKIQ